MCMISQTNVLRYYFASYFNDLEFGTSQMSFLLSYWYLSSPSASVDLYRDYSTRWGMVNSGLLLPTDC